MGQKLGAKVVLASATPSTTSYHKYDVVTLSEPYVKTRKKYRFVQGDSINAPIIYALREHYEEGGQSLLFLPTRGNFKYLYCQKCGRTHTCPFCSVGMALHRKHRHLKCHYCNYTEAIRESCVHCGHTPLSSERIGTQEAMELIEASIEGIRIEQFDKDSITTANKLVKALRRFESGESDLLLGTQMLSKGHDYPNITLAVIMGLDHIMGMADYRSRERAMSLLFQIAGRSGRAKEAEVLIQTVPLILFERRKRDEIHTGLGQCGRNEAAPGIRVAKLEAVGLCRDIGEGVLRGGSDVRGHRESGDDAALESRNPDHEELIQIAREDREEVGALQRGKARVLGQLKHALIEREPAQLAVEKAVSGQELIVCCR